MDVFLYVNEKVKENLNGKPSLKRKTNEGKSSLGLRYL